MPAATSRTNRERATTAGTAFSDGAYDEDAMDSNTDVERGRAYQRYPDTDAGSQSGINRKRSHMSQPSASTLANNNNPTTATGVPPAAPVSGHREATEVIKAKLPHFMHHLPSSLEHKLPPPPAYPTTTAEGGKGQDGGAYPTSWSPRDYYDYYALRTLQRRLDLKNLLVATIAEFAGTFMFLFFALAINSTTAVVKANEQAAGNQNTDLIALLVSSTGFAFSLAISAWIFFRVSGGVQNPAITLALTLTGALTWTRFVALSFAQYVGAIAASGLLVGLYPDHVLNSRTTIHNVTVNQAFWLEFFMTSQLILTVLMLAAEKHRGTFLAPVGIGLSLLTTQLLGQPYTGASVNPARTLGPDVAQHTFSGYSWIYYAAPYLAALFASLFYMSLKWVKYETTTPDQDADESRAGQLTQVLVDAHGNHVGRIDTFVADEYQAQLDAQEKAEQEAILNHHRTIVEAVAQEEELRGSYEGDEEGEAHMANPKTRPSRSGSGVASPRMQQGASAWEAPASAYSPQPYGGEHEGTSEDANGTIGRMRGASTSSQPSGQLLNSRAGNASGSKRIRP